MPDHPFTVTVDETRRYPPIGAAMGHFEESVDVTDVSDPFHVTVVQPKGVRSAWAVLRGRYCARVRIDGTPQVIARVMEAVKEAELDGQTIRANRYTPLGRVTRADGSLDVEKLRQEGL